MQLSPNFSLAHLTECGKTQKTLRLDNQPKRPETIQFLTRLAVEILEPVQSEFGPVQLTFGFCSPVLARAIQQNIKPHIAPKIDQHSACELNSRGKLICGRRGAACDFYVEDYQDNMQVIALWITQNLTFDRLYFYGLGRPIHVSIGPDESHFVQIMNMSAKSRRIPGRNATHQKAVDLLLDQQQS